MYFIISISDLRTEIPIITVLLIRNTETASKIAIMPTEVYATSAFTPVNVVAAISECRTLSTCGMDSSQLTRLPASKHRSYKFRSYPCPPAGSRYRSRCNLLRYFREPTLPRFICRNKLRLGHLVARRICAPICSISSWVVPSLKIR